MHAASSRKAQALLFLAAFSLLAAPARAADARLNRMIELWEQDKPAIGAFGLMSPHIKNVDEARALVANSRYPQKVGATDVDPLGERGVSPSAAARYWGIPVPEYFEKADAWPLDPKGEVAVIAMIESGEAVQRVLAVARDLDVPCGILVFRHDIEKRIQEGFKYLVIAGTPGETEEALRIGMKAAGR